MLFQRLVKGKCAVGAAAARMHHALGNSFTVEMRQFLEGIVIVECQRTLFADADTVVVVGNGGSGCRGQD
jgi:hypothetical protein